MLRHIKYIVVHSTQSNTEVEAEFIRDKMKEGGRRPMFHIMIDRFGHCMRMMGCNLLADISHPFNENCFHIAYVGGVRRGEGCDTRSPIQHHAMFVKLKELHRLFPDAQIVGADYFNGNQKDNPGFDVVEWLEFHRKNSEHWVDYEENENGKWIFVE